MRKELRTGKALIFFCRKPAAGKVKTRLAASIGGGLAAGLYSCFLKDLSKAARRSGAEVFLFHTPPARDGRALKRLLKEDFKYLPQRGADLGERMLNAFAYVFGAGFRKAVIIGSDTPDLRAADLREAFAALAKKPAVIGPAHDGGYYLLGFERSNFLPEVFAGITWSGADVFSRTMQRFKKAGRGPCRLKKRHDIDTLKDLLSFYRRQRRAGGKSLAFREIRLNLGEVRAAERRRVA